jgi:small subunit ribosomal protein S16
MAVKMRLMRMGDHKDPFYRIVVVDSRKARGGEYIEKIGHYNPTKNPAIVELDVEKAKEWLAKGVQPTETVKNLLVKAGALEKSARLSPAKTNPKNKKEK